MARHGGPLHLSAEDVLRDHTMNSTNPNDHANNNSMLGDHDGNQNESLENLNERENHSFNGNQDENSENVPYVSSTLVAPPRSPSPNNDHDNVASRPGNRTQHRTKSHVPSRIVQNNRRNSGISD